MSQSPQEPAPQEYKARFRTRRTAMLVEFAAVTAMVIAVLMLVSSYRRGGVAKTLANPGTWLLVLGVSALGTASNLAHYYLGQKGTEEILEHFPQIKGKRWEQIETTFQRWGARTLLLSGVPVVGIVLATAAGAFGIKRSAFLLWIFLGKVLRNWILVLLFLSGYEVLSDTLF